MLPALEQMLSPFCVSFSRFHQRFEYHYPEQMIEKAKGETAYLPCKFTSGPEDQGPLDIEWLLSPADNQKVDGQYVVTWQMSGNLCLVSVTVDTHRWGTWEPEGSLRLPRLAV